MLSPKVTRTETAISGRRLSSVEPEEVTAGGRGTWSLRHNDLSAVRLIPSSLEAWRSGRSKNAESIFLVTTMGSADARLASPAFFLVTTTILQGRALGYCQSSNSFRETTAPRNKTSIEKTRRGHL